jgi:hypothetical protein
MARRGRTADAGLFRRNRQPRRALTDLAVGGHRSVTHRGTVSTDLSASVYKSTPLDFITVFYRLQNHIWLFNRVRDP